MSVHEIVSACLEALRASGAAAESPLSAGKHQVPPLTSAEDFPSSAPSSVPFASPCARVCLTGGEPSLQIDSELLTELHEAGFIIHVETNGTLPLPTGIDWVTLSPKEDVEGLLGNGRVVLQEANELKLVYSDKVDPSRWLSFPASWHFLQPCALSEGSANTSETVAYILSHPFWRLSLQTHKLLHIR